MSQISQGIDVHVPLRTAYDQWTQFEEFPRFMEGVHEVTQTDDTHLQWRAHREGRELQWESEIVEQVPDQLIEWRDVGGPGNHGRIRFMSVDDETTHIELEMDLAARLPHSEEARHEVELRRRIEQDLMRFKQMLETQGHASGAWRGEVHGGQARRPPPFEV